MSWKEIVEELPKRIDLLEKMLDALMAHGVSQDARLKRIEARLQAIHQEKSQSVGQMADRLIEMSMVQRGESQAANVHHRTTPSTTQGEPSNLWGDLPDEAQWPPKGIDVVARL